MHFVLRAGSSGARKTRVSASSLIVQIPTSEHWLRPPPQELSANLKAAIHFLPAQGWDGTG